MVEQLFSYRVIEAANGEAAIELSRQEKPVLILMDLVLPMMSGLEAMVIIRSEPTTANIPFIIISDHCWASDIHDKAMARGAVHCIDKAHLLDQLPVLVAPILER